jgi:hypothetical protein
MAYAGLERSASNTIQTSDPNSNTKGKDSKYRWSRSLI